MFFGFTKAARERREAARKAAQAAHAAVITELRELITEAETGDRNAMSELMDGRGHELLYLVREYGNYDTYVELAQARTLAWNTGQDKLEAEAEYRQNLVYLKDLKAEYRSSSRLAERYGRLLIYLNAIREVTSSHEYDYNRRLWQDLGTSALVLRRTLARLVQRHFSQLLERAPSSPTARKEARQLVRLTVADHWPRGLWSHGVRLLQLPPAWDRWVAAQDKNPELEDFAPRPQPKAGEYRLRAVEVLAGWADGDELSSLVEAKLILAAANGDSKVATEVGEVSLNHLAVKVLEYHRAQDEAQAETNAA